MGNAESGNPIRNMDKRTARREYREDFAAAITRYRQKTGYSLSFQGKKGQETSWVDDGHVKVFVRKRPIFQHELDNSEFDVVSCFPDRVVVHDARMHNDMKRQLMNHHEFTFDRVFHEKTTNDIVYQQSARPLVHIAVNGGYSTALVYGQTGSGKTFTMSSIYQFAAKDIFDMLHEQSERFATPPVVSVSFVEIAGDHVSDLLNAFKPAQLTTGPDGSVHPYPVVEPVVQSAEDLLALVQHGLNIRTTAATGVHDTSSRSHALLRIYINRYETKDAGVEGTLTLVDLAGSEHRIDSMYHGKERRKETSHINASLMALKDCIRLRAGHVAAALASAEDKESFAKAMALNLQSQGHIYRKSKLTMALKNSFALPQAKTIVIATVSPASKDTEHSLNTLRHACIMHGQEGDPAETRFVTGGTVTSEQIGEVNLTALARKNQVQKRQSGSLDGPKTSNGNTLDNRMSRAAKQEAELTEKMKLKMRRLSEQKSFAALSSEIKDLLKQYRQRLGREQRQVQRLRINRVEEFLEDAMKKVQEEEEELQRAAEEDNEEVADEVPQFHASLREEEVIEEMEGIMQLQSDSRSKAVRPLSGRSVHSQYEDDFEDVPPQGRATTSTVGHTPVSKRPPSAGRMKSAVAASAAVQSPPAESRLLPSRLSCETVYDAVFLVKDEVPLPLLLVQLRALLRCHGYSESEVNRFVESKVNRTSSATVSNQPSALQRQSLERGNSSGRAVTPQSARPQSGKMHQTPEVNVQSARRIHHYQDEDSVPVVQSAAVVTKRRPPTPTQRRSPCVQQTQSTLSSQQPAAVPLRSQSSTDARGRTMKTSVPSDDDSSFANAKQRLAEEAEQKRLRMEAAKAFREEQERKKVEKLAQKKGGKGVIVSQEQQRKAAEVAANDAERAEHLSEIARLTAMLEDDQQVSATADARLSAAKKFGIKKQLSLHKAAILKLERAKLALQQGPQVASAVGAGAIRATNAMSDDLPLPTTQRSVQSEPVYHQYGPSPGDDMPIRPMQQQQQQQPQQQPRKKKAPVRGAFEYDPSDWDTNDDAFQSQREYPDSNAMRERPPSGSLRRQTSGASVVSGDGGVKGFHIEERTSYDSDALSRAFHDPVGLRTGNVQQQQPPPPRQILSYAEFFEAREDVPPPRSQSRQRLQYAEPDAYPPRSGRR